MHIYGLDNGNDEPVCREGVKTQTQSTDLWTQWRMARVGHIEQVAPTYIRTPPRVSRWEAAVSTGSPARPALCGDPEAWEGGSRGRKYVYIITTDSCCCTAETNTTL